jgi:hypothetical protein
VVVPSISVTLRIEDARLEIERLRRELAAWLGERRKRDTLQQFKTQLAALEGVLLKALVGVEAELSVAAKTQGFNAIDVCRRVERGTVWVRRVWSFFRWRFDQRDDPQLGRVLAAADEVVWSCYVEPFRAAGLVQPAPTIPCTTCGVLNSIACSTASAICCGSCRRRSCSSSTRAKSWRESRSSSASSRASRPRSTF